MKGLTGLLALTLLCACAEVKTLEDLEQEALVTGDWSAVEKREKKMAERQARREAGCRSTETLLCDNVAGVSRCYCNPATEKIRIY